MARTTAQRVVAAKEHSQATRDFLGLARRISSQEGWRESDVFTKWLEAAACALRNPVLKMLRAKDKWDENEERYMRIVRSCRKPQETMTAMSHMLAIITQALEEWPQDFIGPVFMEVAANSHVGQFFTPSAVSELIARMSLLEAREMLYDAYIREGRTKIALSEPACGVGGMVLAANQVLREQGVNPQTEAHWTCVDIDRSAFNGAFIQLNLTGSSATVIHGNSLSLEAWETVPTIMAVLRPE